MRPIDADAFTNAVALYMTENAYLNDTALDVLKKVAKWLEEAPTLDYAPVVYGEWKKCGQLSRTQWLHRCSLCGCPQDYAHNFCSNCGAKMMTGGKKDG